MTYEERMKAAIKKQIIEANKMAIKDGCGTDELYIDSKKVINYVYKELMELFTEAVEHGVTVYGFDNGLPEWIDELQNANGCLTDPSRI